MGQVKRRGSFEERKQQAIVRMEKERQQAEEETRARLAANKAAWDALTEEEKEAARERYGQRRSGKHILGLISAMALLGIGGVTGASTSTGRRRARRS